MSATILISSSPPHIFARSPTPIEVSSPMPSPSTLFRDGSSKLFKTTQKQRGGVSFDSNARSLLTTKVGAENLPLRSSPRRDKFKVISSQSSNVDVVSPRLKFLQDISGSQLEEKNTETRRMPPRLPHTVSDESENLQEDVFDITEEDYDRRRIERSLQKDTNINISPLHLRKATPRRKDWTPTRSGSPGPSIVSPESPLHSAVLSPSIRMYSFVNPAGEKRAHRPSTLVATCSKPSASSCVDIDMLCDTPTGVTTKTGVPKDLPKPSARKRNKTAAKKPLTITALATSNYGEEQQRRKLTPMQEYLNATQVNAIDEPNEVTGPPAKGKARVPAKRLRATKKAPPKIPLQSPTSALKAVESLEVVFGSASQLARDESPTLLRETLEAIRQSEAMLSSDPFSPQRTQPISIEAISPQNLPGTSRYVKRRNLWGVAGRDEDNALLQVDTVDLVDSPAVREALAGKDVLVQPGGPFLSNTRSLMKESIPFQAQKTPLNHKGTPLLDIDDIVTPKVSGSGRSVLSPQKRMLHTSASAQQPRKTTPPVEENKEKAAVLKKPSSAKSKRVPVKPSYAGFSTGDLQKQISAFGFKAVKSRDKMIELLDRCWEDKHGPAPGDNIDQDTLTHGDFLSKVHDITARPVPKVKKPRKRKSEDAELKTSKEPKRRKKVEPKPKDAPEKIKKAKTPRKAAAKKALSEEFVMDVDDIDDFNTEKTAPSKTSDAVSESVTKKKTTPRKKTSKAKEVAKKQETTPPPLALKRNSSPPLPESHALVPIAAAMITETDPSQPLTLDGSTLDVDATLQPQHTPPLSDIKDQVWAAISFESKYYSSLGAGAGTRNHVKNPTWREKILMYDPIVLEDLTRWLNTEGFRSIGEDREVNPLEVRTWCEENGVCCLWKGGWRGRRKGGDD
ncbi:5'-flap endonuclease [Knufia peltigerae]|uniref:Structure-specific endonuclease subunit SLX4 n=1 Tax=Knufia peltigerae TaxID=1002370 RepID=A0AA39D2J0_9EURO|nr:5'-flap endonuclease [Knufia peltigerae]